MDGITGLGRTQIRPLPPDEKKALLINAYNAFTIEWVVDNYPIQSIWNTSTPFTEARHTLGGKKVSLDELETQLRAMGDPRIHAAVAFFCAAKAASRSARARFA